MAYGPRKFESSFDGEIHEIPNIHVDNFEKKNKLAYFLSHAHSDHTCGMYDRLDGECLHKNGAKIYMTEETRVILSKTFPDYTRTRQYEIVEPLKVGMTYSIDLPDGQSFVVTLIPATHMIGAVMFLFKTNEKTVLFTGDFVVEEDDINKIEKLHNTARNPLKIDTMYVDATFDSVDYQHFPSRSMCHGEVVNAIRKWLGENNCGVALYQNYKYGYEDVHKEIYREIGTQIYSKDKKMLDTYRALYGNAICLTDDKQSKIHICSNIDHRKSHTNCGVDNDLKYLHIYMSASRGCCYEHQRNSAIHKQSDQALYLCYPTHCSKSQLDFFINYFSPSQIVKFPKNPMSTPKANTPFKEERERRKKLTKEEERLEKTRKKLNF